MSNPKTTITINGKMYDAITGAPVDGGAPTKRSVDGMVGAYKPSVQVIKPQKPSPRTHQPVAAKSVHGKTSKSHALMRHAVPKPAHTHTKPHKAIHATPASKRVTVKSAPLIAEKVPAGRLARASSTQRSSLVSHFGATATPSIVKKHEPVHVAKEQPEQRAPKRATQPHRTVSDKDILLDAALIRAISHEQPKHHIPPKRHRTAKRLGMSPRFASIGATVALVLVIGAFFTYQNLPRFAMRLASSRAGIAASYPGYLPNGYGMSGAISYSPGKIVATFQSKRDNQSYTVTQESSNWNSEALQAAFLKSNKQQAQTYQENGRTVFVYDNTNATWVDGGIWYRIEGKANLSTDQLLKLAASF